MEEAAEQGEKADEQSVLSMRWIYNGVGRMKEALEGESERETKDRKWMENRQ